MTLRDWPADTRPRERLLAHGASRLSDVELIAICLRSGIRGRGVIDLARDLVAQFGGLRGLFSADPATLRRVPGLGNAKAAQFAAIVELARRSATEDLQQGALLTSPGAVREYLGLTLGHLPHETFMVLLLDARHRLLRAEELFRGTLTQTSVYPREVVKAALTTNACAVILAHNHPSGAAEPSTADELLTRQLVDALKLVDVRVLDHFIVAGGRSLSFAERGLL